MASRDALKIYREKRDFRVTPEPQGSASESAGNVFVIQKHAARRLHYDFRLELDGVLKSWAVPKGPSLDPADKRLAVRTEDHPLEYAGFEGVIPEGYGAGTVMLWDYGTWEPLTDAEKGLQDGSLKFTVHGQRLQGNFALVRMKSRNEKRENWLLIKERDRFADAQANPTKRWTDSVRSFRDMPAIRSQQERPQRKRRKNRRPAGKSGRLAFVPPQLATLRDQPPDGEEWLHEAKYDGYRIQVHIAGDEVRLLTRNNKDWSHRYPLIVSSLSKLKVDDAIIDGELIAVDENGHSSFASLQNADEKTDLLYYAFDLLRLNGHALASKALTERKKRLKAALSGSPPRMRFSDHIEGNGARVIEHACAMKLEGIISKKRHSPYRSGRGRTWIKSKCVGNDEFVVGGYRRSEKAGRAFSSLLLGEYVGDDLVYRGRVGTGFDSRALKSIAQAMKPLSRQSSPFVKTPGDARDRAKWLSPRLVAQIAYTERTPDGRLRHPVFLGLRQDKPAREVTSDMPKKDRGTIEVAGVRLSHPDRIMYPQQGATKADIAQYYERHGKRILKHVKNRPLSLVRCPEGRERDCFFQKHHNKSVPGQLKTTDIEEKSGSKKPYLVIDSVAGLIASAQIGALELHVWGARADRIERPERIVFDLDPDESLAFSAVRSAAREMHDVLEAAGLVSFPLLTGGKGIHVIVPVERRRGWNEVKMFARGLANKLADAAPDRYVATAAKAKRKGRIFLDWLRNERGATAIAPYSLRARPRAPVATPVSWDELAGIDSAARFTLDNIDGRLRRLKADPWEEYRHVRQSVTAAHLEFVR
jgi:bifunctional non-homologous end joining protein LigD